MSCWAQRVVFCQLLCDFYSFIYFSCAWPPPLLFFFFLLHSVIVFFNKPALNWINVPALTVYSCCHANMLMKVFVCLFLFFMFQEGLILGESKFEEQVTISDSQADHIQIEEIYSELGLITPSGSGTLNGRMKNCISSFTDIQQHLPSYRLNKWVLFWESSNRMQT